MKPFSRCFQEQFKKFVDEKKQKFSNIQQKMQELIANVSRFISELEAIHGDAKLTKREEKEKVFWFKWISTATFTAYF